MGVVKEGSAGIAYPIHIHIEVLALFFLKLAVEIDGFSSKSQNIGGQQAKGGQKRELGDDFIATSADKGDLRVQQFLVGIQRVQHAACTEFRLLLDTFLRDAGGFNLCFAGFDLRAGGLEIFPAADCVFARAALDVENVEIAAVGDMLRLTHA